jgi:hypothetical protein
MIGDRATMSSTVLMRGPTHFQDDTHVHINSASSVREDILDEIDYIIRSSTVSNRLCDDTLEFIPWSK